MERNNTNRVTYYDLARELLINRYMASCVLSNLYKMQEVMNYNFSVLNSTLKENKQEKKESSHTLKERKEIKKEKKILQGGIIQFEKFSITNKQYEALVREYGIEIVTESCVLLDGYLKTTNRPLKDNFKKLKEWAISLSMKRRLNDLRTSIVMAGNTFDYKTIEDKKDALSYINSIPEYKRNIDKGVKYLVEKFELNKEDKK